MAHTQKSDLRELLETRTLVGEGGKSAGFMADMFLGNVRLDLIDPFPEQPQEDKKKADPWLESFKKFLWEEVDPNRIDMEGTIPDHVIDGLKKMGALGGLKIPNIHGGLEFSYANYGRTMVLIGGWCGNTSCLVSPPNSLGIVTPIMKIGTDEQKKEFLSQLARHKISAFALTEEDAGSDPSRIQTTATRVYENGTLTGYRINGKKLYTTGLIKEDGVRLADYVAVFAKIKKDEDGVHHAPKRYGLFIVPTDAIGFRPDLRCHFMSYHAIINGVSYYDNIFIPANYLLGSESDGFAQAQACITIARLGLPALCLGGMKQSLQKVRWRCKERKQWFNKSIGDHEDVGVYLVEIAARTLAGEAMVTYCNALADAHENCALESAFAKYMLTEDCWKVTDQAVQVYGGRGVETYTSQKRRGEIPVSLERPLRDSRVNRIFEGTNEIMKLVMKHEGLQPYLGAYVVLADHEQPLTKRAHALWKTACIVARALVTIAVNFYPWSHRQFIKKYAGILAIRTIVTGLRYGARLMRTHQIVASQTCLHALSLVSMSLTLAYAKHHADKPLAKDLADYYCWMMRHDVFEKRGKIFWILWGSHRNVLRLSKALQNGEAQWLEEGILSELKKEGVHV